MERVCDYLTLGPIYVEKNEKPLDRSSAHSCEQPLGWFLFDNPDAAWLAACVALLN